MKLPVVVFGAGGHGRVVVETLRRAERTVEAVVDPAAIEGCVPDGITVLRDEAAFLANVDPQLTDIAIGVGPTPGNRGRLELWRRLSGQGLKPCSVVHPDTSIASDAILGVGVQVLARAALQVGVVVGDDVVINTGAIVDHGVFLGAHVHVAPGAVLLGECRVGQGAFVGAGALVHPGVQIGETATVGMGAIVLADVPSGSIVTGVFKG